MVIGMVGISLFATLCNYITSGTLNRVMYFPPPWPYVEQAVLYLRLSCYLLLPDLRMGKFQLLYIGGGILYWSANMGWYYSAG